MIVHQSDSIAGRALALHLANLGLISGMPYVSLSKPAVINEHKAKSNPRASLDVTQNLGTHKPTPKPNILKKLRTGEVAQRFHVPILHSRDLGLISGNHKVP